MRFDYCSTKYPVLCVKTCQTTYEIPRIPQNVIMNLNTLWVLVVLQSHVQDTKCSLALFEHSWAQGCWCVKLPAECTALLFPAAVTPPRFQSDMFDNCAHSLLSSPFFSSFLVTGCVSSSTLENNFRGNFVAIGQS